MLDRVSPHVAIGRITQTGVVDMLGSQLVAVVAGPAIYLLAHALIRLRLAGTVAWRRVAGAAACVLAGLVAQGAEALVVGALLVMVLVAVIVGDRVLGASREEIEAAADARHGVASA